MSTTSIRSEYEFELDAERGKRLRRRFMWFCGINLFFSMFQVPSLRAALRQKLAVNAPRMPREMAVWAIVLLIPTVSIYLVAFFYAWLRKPQGATMVRLALWLTI